MTDLGPEKTTKHNKQSEYEHLLKERDATISALEMLNQRLEKRVKELESRSAGLTPLSELDETMKKLIARISMILQAEKCLVLIPDEDGNWLSAIKPAIGFSDEDVKNYRISILDTLSGEVFRENKSVVFEDALHDTRCIKEKMLLYEIRNGISVPLTVEKRDEETGKIVDSDVIGVISVFNKRYGGSFLEEDVKMLSRLAQNAAAVIASAQLYREVIAENEELGHVIESVNSGLIMVDRSGRIMQMNASARQILGFTQQEKLVGHHYKVIDEEAVRDFIAKSLEDHGDIDEEITLRDRIADEEDAEKYYHVQSALVRDQEHKEIGIVAILNDVTEYRNIERMKTAFVSTVSHELRTPLTSIKGFISTLLEDSRGFDKQTVREFYLIIDQECDSLMRLINYLLNMSRIESGRELELYRTTFMAKETIEKVVAVQKPYSGRHDFYVEVADNVGEIFADKDKFDQILTNLVSNAVKYSPNGGTVSVRARRKNGDLLVEVADEGIGIPKEHFKTVFKRFHRVDNRDTRKAGGTGIGLYLVKHMVEAHGGQIWIESEIGQGSHFIFEMPVYAKSESEKEMPELHPAEGHVDSNEDISDSPPMD